MARISIYQLSINEMHKNSETEISPLIFCCKISGQQTLKKLAYLQLNQNLQKTEKKVRQQNEKSITAPVPPDFSFLRSTWENTLSSLFVVRIKLVLEAFFIVFVWFSNGLCTLNPLSSSTPFSLPEYCWFSHLLRHDLYIIFSPYTILDIKSRLLRSFILVKRNSEERALGGIIFIFAHCVMYDLIYISFC